MLNRITVFSVPNSKELSGENMKSVTLHNVDESLLALIKEKSKAQKLSIN
jgi:hypothetical protein